MRSLQLSVEKSCIVLGRLKSRAFVFSDEKTTQLRRDLMHNVRIVSSIKDVDGSDLPFVATHLLNFNILPHTLGQFIGIQSTAILSVQIKLVNDVQETRAIQVRSVMICNGPELSGSSLATRICVPQVYRAGRTQLALQTSNQPTKSGIRNTN